MGVVAEPIQNIVSGLPESSFSLGPGKRADTKKSNFWEMLRVVHEASKQKSGLAGVNSLLHWVLQHERPPHQLLKVWSRRRHKGNLPAPQLAQSWSSDQLHHQSCTSQCSSRRRGASGQSHPHRMGRTRTRTSWWQSRLPWRDKLQQAKKERTVRNGRNGELLSETLGAFASKVLAPVQTQLVYFLPGI